MNIPQESVCELRDIRSGVTGFKPSEKWRRVIWVTATRFSFEMLEPLTKRRSVEFQKIGILRNYFVLRVPLCRILKVRASKSLSYGLRRLIQKSVSKSRILSPYLN